MRILIVTNLYPPQELGGYGRSMADFAWGFQQHAHQVMVLTSDAPTYKPMLFPIQVLVLTVNGRSQVAAQG